tara:strand:+ start:407 stop:655 length:249 start_codon:yes stop_codon:yes gene_type:complete
MAKTTNSSQLVIRHKAEECIGCCLCEETAPQYFSINEEGLAVLLNSTIKGAFACGTGLELDRNDLETAAEGCPVDIIRVDAT